MKRRVLPLLLAATLLSSCSDGMFSDEKKTPLKGERIAVLQLQKDLAPDPALQGVPPALPEPWSNQFWPQRGGYPNHAMGHLALGTSLKQVWSASIGKGGGRRRPLIAGPVIAEGAVFTLDTTGDVTAFDLANGHQKWRESSIPRGENVDTDAGALGGGLAYAAGKLYVTNGYKQLAAINPENGKLEWKTTLPAPARTAPLVADDRVYVVTLDNRLLVFAAADGTPLWNHQGVAQETNLLGSASPAADQSLVVLPLSSGELLGLRPENGQITWEDNLSAVRRMGALSSITDIRALPVIDQGVVFASSYSGRFVALDEVTGRRLWQREAGSAETPWPAGDTVFAVTTEQQLAAFARQGGGIRWNTQLPRFEGEDIMDAAKGKADKDKPIVWTGPVLAGGRLIIASTAGDMAEVSPTSGKVLKTTHVGGPVALPPVVAAGVLLFLTENGELIAYR
jgi:outer membrane protein assembly factor BamB